MRVLITNASYRNALAAIRGMGSVPGVRVEAADRRRTGLLGRIPQGFVSRYCAARHTYANPADDPEGFVEDLQRILRRRAYDVLLPLSVTAVMSCLRFEDQLRPLVAIPFGSFDTLSNANDKAWLMRTAEEVGVPIPRTAEVRSIPAARDTDLPYPLVLKATRGAASNAVWFIDGPEDWQSAESALDRLRARVPTTSGLFFDIERLLVQENVPGDVHDVCLLADHGRLRALLTQRRLVTTGLRGGSGIVNVTTREPMLRELAERLVSALAYHGVAQIEFKKDERDGSFRLLELNGKFWGTLALSMEAGINFPHLAAQLALEEPFADRFDYEEGVAYRWRYPDEFLAWLRERRDGRRFRDLYRRIPAVRTATDWRWSDPLPSLHQLAATAWKAYAQRRER
jgi:predicted ATP-grasp superfamily ATP-dependent carboligase